MNFHRNKRSRTRVEINLLPMIDVLLVLLIFFVVSTTFTHETGININLPEAKGEQNSSNENVITLLIDKDGHYYIATRDNTSGDLVNEKVSSLRKELTRIMGNAPQTPFVISADGKTPHQAVIRALDIASQVGFKHIAFATKEPETAP
jgi:biopolymer transport protein ExbD